MNDESMGSQVESSAERRRGELVKGDGAEANNNAVAKGIVVTELDVGSTMTQKQFACKAPGNFTTTALQL